MFTFSCVALGGSGNGLTAEEMDKSLITLTSVAAACGADMSVLRKKTVEGDLLMADYVVRKRVEEDDFLEVRLAC